MKRFDKRFGFMTEDEFIDAFMHNLPNAGLLQEKWRELPDDTATTLHMEKESVDHLLKTEDLAHFGLVGYKGVIKELPPGNRTIWLSTLGILLWD